jgi:hypothetical protein
MGIHVHVTYRNHSLPRFLLRPRARQLLRDQESHVSVDQPFNKIFFEI